MAIRILIVDDATFIRDMLKKNLRDRIPDAHVVDAADGNRAVAALKHERFDLILSDWEMPGMCGEELLRWVRSTDVYRNTPFIMVTSRGDRENVVQAVKSGVSDYISKPFTPDELYKKVTKQLVVIGKMTEKELPSGGSGQTQGIAFASVDVLTGGGSAASQPQKKTPKAATSSSLAALTGGAAGADNQAGAAKAAAKPKAAAKKAAQKTAQTKGKAQLRFANRNGICVIREISLQAMQGLMQRGNGLPTVFDQAAVDISCDDGEQIARLNGYVSSLQAADNNPDCNIVKITIRFVDKDPEKFEFLSKYIARF